MSGLGLADGLDYIYNNVSTNYNPKLITVGLNIVEKFWKGAKIINKMLANTEKPQVSVYWISANNENDQAGHWSGRVSFLITFYMKIGYVEGNIETNLAKYADVLIQLLTDLQNINKTLQAFKFENASQLDNTDEIGNEMWVGFKINCSCYVTAVQGG